MIKKYLDKIRTMDKQALTAFGTCGLFFLLALVQLLILAFSSFGRSWDHILLMLVDVGIASVAGMSGVKWKNRSTENKTRTVAAAQSSQKTGSAQNTLGSQTVPLPPSPPKQPNDAFDDIDWDDEF